MKRTSLIMAVLLMAGLLLSACSQPATAPAEQQAGEAEPAVVEEVSALGVVYFEADASFSKGAKDMADKLGLTLVEADAAGDAAALVAKVQEMVTQKVSGLLVVHNATDEMAPVVDAAVEAGIEVVTVGNIPNPDMESLSSEVLLDDFDMGYGALNLAYQSLGGKGTLVVVGQDGSEAIALRNRIVELMQAIYPNVNVVAFGSATDSADAIKQSTTDALAANADAGAIWCSTNALLPGVVEAVKESGKTVPVYSSNVGMSAEDVALLKADGSPIKAIAYADMEEAGRVAVRVLATAAGGTAPLRYEFILANVVDAADVAGLAEGELPPSKLNQSGWSDVVLGMYEVVDAAGAAEVKAAIEAEVASVVNPPDITLPEPAVLPADFEVKDLVIAGVHEQTNYQHNELLRSGMDEIAEMFKVKVVRSNAEGDWAKQASDMEVFIEQGVDTIIVDHGSTDNMEPVIKQAIAKGITVVTFDVPTPNVEEVACQLSQDDYGHAFMSLRPMISHIGGKGKIGVAWLGGYAPLENRIRVLRMMLELFPGIQTFEFGQDVDNFVDAAMSDAEAVMTANPDLKAFWATWDGLAVGIQEALMQMNRNDVLLYTVDISSEDVARMAMENSPWVLTATSDAKEVGRVTMLMAIAASYDQPIPRYVRIPAFSVTQEQARLVDEGVLPSPVSSGEGWTPFMVALYEKVK